MKVFVFDASKCNGCHNCQVACKDEHVGNEWPPYAGSQPNTGQFWMRVKQKEHGQIPMVRVEYTAWTCMHCDNCVAGATCDSEAFIRREDGLIYIDPSKCSGCAKCVEACPYETVFFNESLNIAQKCTGCAHLIDKGELPHCVDLCATGGLRFGDAEDFAGEIAEAETMLAAKELGPHVYYLNMPRLFLGGEVWDPIENEIIEGAAIVLTSEDGTVANAESDDFGDFCFMGIEGGSYSLKIEANGYKPVAIEGIDLKESLFLGDYALERV